MHNLSSNSPLVVTLTVTQLTSIIEDAVQKKIKEALPPPPIRYLTGKETAKKLGVSRQTITNYTKKGIIKRSDLDNLKRYAEPDIEAALVILQRYKRA
jgi:hypothetical protein